MATTVKEVKLQQNGSMISPVTMIKSVKNLSGTDLQTLLDAKASSSHTHSEYWKKSYKEYSVSVSKGQTVNWYIPDLEIGEQRVIAINYTIAPTDNYGAYSILNLYTPTTGSYYIYFNTLISHSDSESTSVSYDGFVSANSIFKVLNHTKASSNKTGTVKYMVARYY